MSLGAITCPRCNGSGREPGTATHDCYSCNGEGYIDDPTDEPTQPNNPAQEPAA